MWFRFRHFAWRLTLFLLAALFATGLFIWLFEMPLEAWYFGRRIPGLARKPVPVRDTTVTQSPGTKLAFCSCEFDLPWTDVDSTKTKVGPNTTILYFGSGLITVVKCEPPREFVDGVVSSTKVNPEYFRGVSDYQLTRLILETTPSAVSLRTPRAQARAMSMLVMKAIATPRSDSGMFSIHTDEFDGFQYEDPEARPDRVLVSLFAADRGLEFQFFLKYNGGSTHVTQAEINRIVRTVHKVGPYSPPKQATTRDY
jgi:hypothetical protein